MKKDWRIFFRVSIFLGIIMTICLLNSDIRRFFKEVFQVVLNADPNNIQNYFLSLGMMGPAIIILLMIIQAIFPPIPSFVIIMSSIWVYGSWAGSLYAFIGGQIGAIITYWIAFWLGKPFVNSFISTKKRKYIEEAFDRYGMYAIFIARITPILSVDAITYIAGASGMKFWKFFLAVAIGQIPALLIFSLVGKAANSIFELVGYLMIGALFLFGTNYYIRLRKKVRSVQDNEKEDDQ